MTTTRIKKVVTTIDDSGKAVAETHSEGLLNGQWWPLDPVPLATAGPEWDEWKAQFSGALIAERDQLLIEKTALTEQLQSLTSQRDNLQAEVTRTADRDEISAQLSSVTQERVTQSQRIAELESQLDALLHPPGPDLSTRDGVREYIRAKRYSQQIAGFTIGGVQFSTMRDSQGDDALTFGVMADNAMKWLMGDATLRALKPDGVFVYTSRNGWPVQLQAMQVVRAWQCMLWYIDECYTSEYSLCQELLGSEPDLSSIVASADNDAHWPQNQFAWEQLA